MENTKNTSTPTYEEKIDRLKAIIDELQNSNLSITEFADRYYEGLNLVNEISEQLNNIKDQIETVTSKFSNQFNNQYGINNNH